MIRKWLLAGPINKKKLTTIFRAGGNQVDFKDSNLFNINELWIVKNAFLKSWNRGKMRKTN